MKKILPIILCAISLSAFAYSPQVLRFHCASDTTKINSLLEEGKSNNFKKPNELIAFYANKLLDTPYVASTLEGDEEFLTINIDELDCTTFVETLIALTKTTLSKRTAWQDFAYNLENIRYRGGNINGYPSRLHYISDWIVDNTARGNVREITTDFPRTSSEIKSINFMSNHRESYPALKSDDNFSKIKNMEIGYRNHKFPLLKKTYLRFKDVKESFTDGDIIALVTKIEGLDVSHMGIIKVIGSTPFLLHASSKGKKVMVDANDLAEMLRQSKTNTGIRIIRVIE